jgi:ribonuclease HI
MVQQAIATQGDLPELAHDHTAFLYTDGSRLKEVPNGAPGIATQQQHNNPKTRSVTSVEVAWDGEAADTKSNTINRAELVGLLTAMRQGDECHWHDGSIHIATDSLASIYAIAKALTRPQDVNEHRHLSILKEIIQEIRNAPGQVHIHKVMAHTRIIGNEIADQAAVRLASGEDTADITYDSPSNSRSDMHWPHQVTQKQTNTGQVITCVSPIADIVRNLGFLPETCFQEGGVLRRGFPRFRGLPEAHCGSTPVPEARHTGFWVPPSGRGACRRPQNVLPAEHDCWKLLSCTSGIRFLEP